MIECRVSLSGTVGLFRLVEFFKSRYFMKNKMRATSYRNYFNFHTRITRQSYRETRLRYIVLNTTHIKHKCNRDASTLVWSTLFLLYCLCFNFHKRDSPHGLSKSKPSVPSSSHCLLLFLHLLCLHLASPASHANVNFAV